MIVNSSRGGGSKDTWVLEDGDEAVAARPPIADSRRSPALPDLRYGALDRPGTAAAAGARRGVGSRPARGSTADAGAGYDARADRPRALLARAATSRAPSTPRAMIDGVFQADLQGRPEAGRRAALAGRRCWRSWAPGAPWTASTRAGRSRGAGRRRSRRGARRADARPRPRASVLASVERAREGARAVRDVISAEMWEAINTFALDAPRRRPVGTLRTGPYSVYAATSRSAAALFWGVADRTMLRDEA